VALEQSTAVSEKLEEELLLLLSRQGKRVPIPVFLVAAILAIFVSDQLPMSIWGSWLALVGIVLMVRLHVLGKLPDLTALSQHRRIQIAIVLSAVNGVTHGLSIGFFPFLPELERAIQSMLLVALCTASVATTAGYMPIFLSYLIPMLLPLSLLWAISPGVPDRSWVEVSVAVLVAMMGMLLIVLARDAFRLFRESIEIRLQQVALNDELRIALQQAEEANQSKTRFLASASHDLRQPIHTLSLFSAALAMRSLDDRSRDIAKHMDIALQSLASEFDAILDISKLDAGVVQFERTAVNLRDVLDRLCDEFVPAARAKDLELSLACPKSSFVDTDELLMERVLRNLISNAVKYTDVGKVEVAVSEQTEDYLIAIADSGRGIAESEQAHIFEEFYQIDNPERDRGKGLGLGLAIVKRLADLLGLEMSMSSSPGKGTEFRLRMPRASPTSEAAETGDRTEGSLADLQVLVVDDEVEVRLGMEALLTGMGCRVELTDSTPSAVHAAQVAQPDIVLADFRLRGDDNGIDAIHSLRKIYPGLPAILISGDIAPHRLRAAEEAGIELLHKPIVVEILKQAMARAREQQNDA
jgi:signal transduction histidine kinase/ActR/RegA family two-component response regulator